MSFRHLMPVVQALSLTGFLAICPSAMADNPATSAYRAAVQPLRLPPMPSEGEVVVSDPAGETPVASDPVPTTAPASEKPVQPETIRERYPDGKIRVERQVALDGEYNYVNHGPFVMVDRRGNRIVAGEYRYGKQHGRWVRHFTAGQGQLFSGSLDKSFQGPFISEATFVDGQLHGTWTIASEKTKFKVIQWCFEKGTRHGKATWWHPNGVKRREVDYRAGLPNGEVLEWARDNRQVRKDRFIDGRQLAKKTEWYMRDKKRYEGTYLMARQPVETFDWAGNTASTGSAEKIGVDQKHGLWTAWYANGQKRLEGNYREDVQVGRFTWWHENGQKQAEGQYAVGAQEGTWITWHPNGMKQSKAVYKAGDLAGDFMRWEPSGKLKELGDFSPSAASRPSDRVRTDGKLLKTARTPKLISPR